MRIIQTAGLVVIAIAVMGFSSLFIPSSARADSFGETFSNGVSSVVTTFRNFLFGSAVTVPGPIDPTLVKVEKKSLTAQELTPLVKEILDDYDFSYLEITKYLTTKVVKEPVYTTSTITNNNNTTTTNTVAFDLSGVTKNGLVYVDSNSSLQAVGAGTAGQVLTSNGSGNLPSWVALPGGLDFASPGEIGSTTPNRGNFTDLSIAYTGDTGYLTGEGAFVLDNTNNIGNGFSLKSNAGAEALGDLMNVAITNRNYQNAGFHLSYYGMRNGFEVVSNSTSSASNALAVTGNNINDSAVGIIGYELGRGTVKISHYRPTGLNDNNASALSIDLKGSGTAAQGIYVDSTETGGTTGNLLRLRNQTVDKFVVNYQGNLAQGGYGYDTTYTKYGNTTGDQFFVGTNGAFRVQRAGAASEAFRTQVSGDTQGRWLGTADGQLKWGSGTATQDIVMKRSTTGILTLDGGMTFNNSNAAYDTVIKGVSDSNLFHADAAADKIGVGLSTPIAAFHISKNGAGNAALAVNQSGAFDIFTASSSGATKYIIDSSGNQISAVGAGWRPLSDSTSALQIQNSSGTAFTYFDTTNSRVGIGTSTPTGALQVTNGTVSFGTASTDSFFVATNGAFRVQRSSTNSEAFRLQINGDANGRILGTSDGRLKWGDGTNTQDVTLRRNNPGQLILDGALVMNNTSGSVDIFTASASGTTKFSVDNSGNVISAVGAGWKPMSDSTSSLQVQTSTGSAYVSFDSTNARVGIGTAAPAGKLHVSGGDIVLDNAQALRIRDSGGTARSAVAYTIGNNLQFYNTASSGVVQIGINNASNTGNIRFFTGANTEKVRIDNAGLAIGATTFGTGATNVLAIANGTVPGSSIVDGIQLYAEDVASSSELKVRDEAGNVTTLSPHNFSVIPEGKSDPMAWSFYSQRGDLALNVDMLKAIRKVQSLSGEQLVFIKNLKTGQYEAESITPSGITLSSPQTVTVSQVTPEPALTTEQLANEMVKKSEVAEYATWSENVWKFVSAVVFEMKATFKKPVDFLAGVVFKGPITVNQDTAGKVVIPAGATKVKVTFTQTFASKPIIYLSPVQSLQGGYTLDQVSTEGFVISLNTAQNQEVQMNWLAVMQTEMSTTNSQVIEEGKAKDPVSTPAPTPSPNPTASPEPSPMVSPEPSTEPVATSSATLN